MDDAALTFVARLRDEASGAVRALRGSLKSIPGKVGDVLIPLKARDDATNVIRGVSGLADKAGRGFLRTGAMVASGMARTGVVVGGALALAGGAAITLGLKTAAGMQTARIGFSTMLGSAKQADAFLRQLSAFAASTPFEFPELQTAASSLISAGIEADKVIPIMRTLGDVTSGMGTGSEGVQRATVALQQMNAAGKITGEDLNQLRDAGIPVYDLLSKATGKSKAEIVKLAQAGKLGHKELGQMMTALETGKGLERFSGLMDKQSRSLTGVVSTLHDTVAMGLAKALQPAIPMLTDLATWANTAATGALPALTAKVGDLVSGIPQLVTNGQGLLAVFKQFGPDSAEFSGALARVTGIDPSILETVRGLLERVGTVLTGVVIPAFQTAGTGALPGLLSPLAALNGLLTLAATHTDAARVALTIIIGVLTAAKLATMAHTVVTTAQGVAASVLAAKESIAAGATRASTAATWLANAARGAATSTLATWIGVKALEFGAWIRSTAATVANTAATVAAAVASGAVRAATVAATAAQWLLNAAMSANPIGIVIGLLIALGVGLVILWKKSSTFRAIVTAAWHGIQAAASAAGSFVMGILRRMGAFFGSTWKVIALVVTTYVRVYVAVIRAGIMAALAIIRRIGSIVGTVRDAFGRARQAAADKLTALVGFVKGIPGKIVGALKGAGTMLLGIGGDIIGGLERGIRNGIDRVTGAVRDLAGKIPGPIKKLLGIASPSKVMARDVGRWIPLGVASGIDSQVGAVARSMRGVAAAATMATPSLPSLRALSAAQSGAVLGTLNTSSGLTVTHRVTFADPQVAAKLSARDVAELLAADPRATRTLEGALLPVRSSAAAARVTAPSSRRVTR